MAVVHKFSGYFVDKGDKFSNSELVSLILEKGKELNSIFQQLHVSSVEVKDSIAIRELSEANCDLAVCERFFRKEPTSGREKRLVSAGEVYRHFKGHKVQVLAVARDTEYTNTYYVIYKHLGNGDVWSRPYDMFISEVDSKKYPNVKQKYRFERIKE